MSLEASVIVCTHNPRENYFLRVLGSLGSQSLGLDRWELLVIDNASKEPVAPRFDISWHPNGRHIHEPKLGLTPARLRGIAESTAELLVFVDDDNILDTDYLEIALRIARERPYLGAWGGEIRPEFEEPPPDWTRPHWPMLALCHLDRDVWANLVNNWGAVPCGAGLCVRTTVAQAYAKVCLTDERRLALGRRGADLTSCEDTDIAWTACDLGLGTGRFTGLKMTHIIPARRLTLEYMAKLIEGLAYSNVVLYSFRGEPPPLRPSWLLRFLRFIRLLGKPWRERVIARAQQRGLIKAAKLLTDRSRNGAS